MEIVTAETDGDRSAVRDFLGKYLDGIAPNAVPSVTHDDLYRPLVPWIRDDAGKIIGAALTCRSQLAAGAATFARLGGSIPGPAKLYLPVLDKHSEPDLLAVHPDRRGEGLASELLTWMEARLKSTGVRVWFGSVTSSLAVTELRRFYLRHGFVTTGPGEALPPRLGRKWSPPYSEQPAFFFYKSLPGSRS